MPETPTKPRRPLALLLLLAALPVAIGLVLLERHRPRGERSDAAPGAIAKNNFKLEELPAQAEAAAPAQEEMEALWQHMQGLLTWLKAQAGVPFRLNEMLATFKNAQEADRWARELAAMGFQVLGRINLPGGGVILKLGWSDNAALGKLAQLAGDGTDTPFDLGLNYLYQTPSSSPEARSNEGASGTTPSGENTLKLMGAAPTKDWGAGVKVAVLDDGLYPHEVFGPNAPRVMDLLGADVATSGAHGTAMASLITGDALGLIGMAPGSDVTMYRVLGEGGVGDAFSVAQGIYAAVADGAQIINMSLGGTGDSALLAEAVRYAQSMGVVVVAAVGNEGVQAVSYPAAYDGVIGVGAVDATNTLTSFSNIGEGVDISAQGLGVLAGSTKTGYASVTSGSSPATASVSGAIAALSAYYGISATQAAQILLANANDYGSPGYDTELGAGTVDMERAMNQNTKGITDAAAVGGIVTYGNNTAAPLNVTVGVQNRGTAPLTQATVTLGAGGYTNNTVVHNIAPGATGVATFQWPASRFGQSNTIQATLTVSPLGKADNKTSNNTQKVTLVKP
jgi:subtilisin